MGKEKSIVPRYHEIDDDDDDDPEILQDGQSVRVRLDMMDSMSDVQRAVALSSMRLCDGLGRPAGCRPGFVFADTDPLSKPNWERQRLYDEVKAELSSRWKGGFKKGDQVTVCGHQLTVTGRDQDTGRYMVADSSALDDETVKRQAYDAYERDLTNAWRNTSLDGNTSNAFKMPGEQTNDLRD